jgi:hypothetical protein
LILKGIKQEKLIYEEAQAIKDEAGKRLGAGKKPQNYIAFLHFACALIAFRAAGLFG